MISTIRGSLWAYPCWSGLHIGYAFGALLFACWGTQVLTGWFMTFRYSGVVEDFAAFDSIEMMVREVSWGWLFRIAHANGASMFFLFLYIHMMRGIALGISRGEAWRIGVIIWVLLMGTAFLGYVLPMGQMSFWALTVITSLLTVIPYVGSDALWFVWGGDWIGEGTLQRVYTLHYLLPLVLGVLMGVHVMAFHEVGSSGQEVWSTSAIGMHPYSVVKDIWLIGWLGMFFAVIVCEYPDVFGHPDNYIEMDRLVTPSHIVPEWYFLPMYGLLRSVPSKPVGVIMMGVSLLGTIRWSEVIWQASFTRLWGSVHLLGWGVCIGWLGGELPIYPYVEGALFVGLMWLMSWIG